MSSLTNEQLERYSHHIRLMASGPRCGLDGVKIPALQPGSSIMPGKVNPVIAEVLHQVCYQVIGNDTALTMVVENGLLSPERLADILMPERMASPGIAG